MPNRYGASVLFCYSLLEAQGIALCARKLRERLGLAVVAACPIVDILEFEIPKLLRNFRFTVEQDWRFEKNLLAVARVSSSQIVVRESVYQRAIGDSPV